MRGANEFARATRPACLIVAGVLLLAGCAHRRVAASVDDDAAIVATLGARDGYLFIVNPFNCLLRESQIREINRLATRSRRSGRLLMAGTEPIDSVEGVRAIRDLGILLQASTLSSSPFARTAVLRSLGWPLVLAVRDGHVIGALAGGHTSRMGSWIQWLEHSAPRQPGVTPTPGDTP